MKSKTRIKIKLNKQKLLQYAVALAVVLILGFCLEYVYNLPVLNTGAGRGDHEISKDYIVYEGFHEEDGKLVFDKDYGYIHVPLGNQYVDKLVYDYEYDGLLNITALVGFYDKYGKLSEAELVLADRNSSVLNRSYLRIGRKASYVNLVVKQEELAEPGLDYIDFNSFDLAFTSFHIQNTPRMNGYRLAFLWALLGLAAFLIIERAQFARHIERGFLVIALVLGMLMIWILPANKVGWDEEIHFERAFWMSSYPRTLNINNTVYGEFVAGIDTWPYNQPDGYEEQKALDAYLNENGVYSRGPEQFRGSMDKKAVQCYVGQTAMIVIGKVLSLPFGVLFRIGRLGNLIGYCAIMYFAIRKVPVGKAIMAMLGLLPTPMFLASVYSYDPMVTACIYLFFACLLYELLNPSQKITWKSYLILCGAFVIGCTAKAVYAPLVLCGLLLPKEKFDSKRMRMVMLGGFVFIFLMEMASFVLPVLLSPSETGDLRGGATSEVGQMSYILGNPIAYAQILFDNIKRTFSDYVFGTNSLALMGHLDGSSVAWAIPMLVTAVVITDSEKSSERTLTMPSRAWIFLTIAASVVLVWTSMYIAYTVPGLTSIAGVQGRYYIPFLFPLYLLFTSRGFVNRWDRGLYHTAVLGAAAVIMFVSIYGSILVPYCF